MELHKRINIDISLTYLCSFMTLPYMMVQDRIMDCFAEFWSDLQMDHMSETDRLCLWLVCNQGHKAKINVWLR